MGSNLYYFALIPGVKCGKYTCALGQKCGKECKIQVEEFEECKNVSVKACIPE